MKKKFLAVLVILAAITFYSALRIQPAEAMGTIYIQADGSISPPEAPIQTLDRMKYALTANADASIIVQRSNIVIDGAFYNLQGDGTQNGFILQDVVNITIKNTLISDCFNGIQLFNASDNTITANAIVGSSYEGVGVYYSSGNVVAGNNITNNQIGIAFYSSSSNSIVHNDFIDNAYQVYTESSTNNWDNGYPSGGNYWSDYTGTDAYSGPNQNQPGSDGIGDTPYNCSENNQDGYPLMQKWTNIAITAISSSKTAVGQGQKVNITIIVQNQGWDAETTSVTLYANTTILSSFTNIALSGRTQTTLTYTWQTASFDKAKYRISANATAIPGETDNRDNTYTYGLVLVTIVGDVDGNGNVNVLDAIDLSNSFGKSIGQAGFNPSADFDDNGAVNILDAITLANNYNQHYP
jgi:parallel beta-helix repeat protein